MTECEWDKLLRIKTSGRDDTNADQYHYPYEPTDYCVLERLANSGYIDRKNVLVDYGSGKGRVDFFLSYQTRCNTIGIEYDAHILETAQSNAKQAVSASRVTFYHKDAVEYQVTEDELMFCDEIDCSDLFESGSLRERILVFSIE